MGNVEDPKYVVPHAEELDRKTESSVGDHEQRIGSSVGPGLKHTGKEQGDEQRVEHQLQLPCRPSQFCSGYHLTKAAAIDQAIDPGAEQSRSQRESENIKNFMSAPLKKLGACEVEDR